MSQIRSLLDDFRLTTAEIIYHMPDHPDVLQSFIWQDYDLPPQFPKLHHFLTFWSQNLDGKLHSVYVMSAPHLATPEVRVTDFLDTLR
ncbi:MAG: Usg family protein [Alphaproteobacteria bacterium]|nr:Usg family protein [Alphaproteobacteria bacterium]